MENKRITAYLIRVNEKLGTIYKGYLCDVGNSVEFRKKYIEDTIEIHNLCNNINIICEDEAVIMGRTLNRAFYDEDGKLKNVFAGNLMVVRYDENGFSSIYKEDIENIEKMLQPIDHIACGKVFLKSSKQLKVWEEQ